MAVAKQGKRKPSLLAAVAVLSVVAIATAWFLGCSDKSISEALAAVGNEGGGTRPGEIPGTGTDDCDRVPPILTLVGASSVEVKTNDLAGFRKWMHLDGGNWGELVKSNKDVDYKAARLTMGGGVDIMFTANAVPAPGESYIIVYTAERTGDICPGDAAKPWSTVARAIKIIQYVEIDSAKPVVVINLSNPVSVTEGETAAYADAGVTVMFKNLDLGVSALDSIVITGTGSYRKTVKKPISNYSEVTIPATASEGMKYTITYYATAPNGQSAVPVSRTVNVTAKSDVVGSLTPIIELNPYRHNWNGKTVEYRDTIINIGGTYIEKGVKRVYYIDKDGNEVTVNATAVPTPTPPSTNNSMSVQRSVSYSLPAGNGYASATATRKVFLLEIGMCDEKLTAPTVTLIGGTGDNNDLTIPANTRWDYDASWSVRGNDDTGRGWPYLIDFNGLNPEKPEAGTYTITYVGIGGCGATTTVTRKVTVQ